MARRLGTRYALYYATLGALDVALDRGRLNDAAELLDELDEHAAALDTDTATSIWTAAAALRQRRLAGLRVDQAAP